jgi:mycothiol synthase
MAASVSSAWLGERRPLVACTVGDLEWWTAQGGSDVDWRSRIRIWEMGDDVVAWTWHSPPAAIDWFVSDRVPAADAAAVHDEISEWATEVVRTDAGRRAAAGPVDPSLAAPLHAELWAPDGWPEAAALVDRGWVPGTTVLTQYLQTLDLDLDAPRLPAGYSLRAMRGPEDIPRRVEAHRAAFAPSRMTVEKYEILTRQDHYSYAHDLVVEAPDGSFAAFTMCWLDGVGSVGEFEPVGTHPDHQRRGLGRVVMRAGLRLMREAGLRDAIVFSLRSNAASEALYQSAGFHELALHRVYTKPIA